MRKLFLLRGVPASGKSTWIQNNELEPYTLSADKIRNIMQSPELTLDGTFKITQRNDNKVWDFIFETLESRMARGEMLIVDATHYKQSLLTPYKQLSDKYRYRLYIVDFTDITLEEALRRNKARAPHQVVPEEVIVQMHTVINSDTEVSKKFKILSPTEALEEINSSYIIDCSNYDEIDFVGDIHGCYEPLQEYFNNNPFSDSTLYVFTGDYIDRGIQNKEVLEFLLQLYDKPNVLLLSGNHEIHLQKYCQKDHVDFRFTSDEEKKIVKKYIGNKGIKGLFKNNIKSAEFLDNTVPQIKDIPTKQLRQLCRTLMQCTVLSFNGKNYIVTHAGITTYPTSTVSTEDMIKGVGGYGDLQALYDTWKRNYTENDILVHAHRNIQNYPIIVDKNIINLCDTIEFGGNLRILKVTKDEMKEVYIKNNTYKVEQEASKLQIDDIFTMLENSKFINKKDLANGISSFNFSRDAFKKSKWNTLTTTARGLFVDMNERKVVARSYNKFFNINERNSTTVQGICSNISFPVKCYKKENGFLGIVALHNDKLLVCSKSTNTGKMAEILRRTLVISLGRKGLKQLKTLLRDKYKDHSFVFECISHEDRHIIEYKEDAVILLDVFKNSLEEERLPYKRLQNVAEQINCKVKEEIKTLYNKVELVEWINNTLSDTELNHEGFVVVGENGFKFKIKSSYYKFWKSLRSILDKLKAGRDIVKDKKTASRKHIEVIQFMENIGREGLQDLDIIDVRNKIEALDK